MNVTAFQMSGMVAVHPEIMGKFYIWMEMAINIFYYANSTKLYSMVTQIFFKTSVSPLFHAILLPMLTFKICFKLATMLPVAKYLHNAAQMKNTVGIAFRPDIRIIDKISKGVKFQKS